MFSLLTEALFAASSRKKSLGRSSFRVCLIHLILFMAHFFASNWESKKTILLLVLLLNFNISRRYVALFGRFVFFGGIIVGGQGIRKNYTYVLLPLTSHGRSRWYAREMKFNEDDEAKKKNSRHNENEIIRKPLED